MSVMTAQPPLPLLCAWCPRERYKLGTQPIAGNPYYPLVAEQLVIAAQPGGSAQPWKFG
jgi:hypothetical protein